MFVPAEIVAAPGAEGGVPGAVVRAFSGPGWAFCRLWDTGARLYTRISLRGPKPGRPSPAWSPSAFDVIDTLLTRWT